MRFFFPTLIFIMLLAGGDILAQTVRNNDRGELIVVFDDGSWRYYEDSDSVLLKKPPTLDDTGGDDGFFVKEEHADNNNTSGRKDKEPAKPRRQDADLNKRKMPPVVDLMKSPPPYPCIVAFSGTDEYSKKKRIDLQKEILFEYTDPEVATYLKGRSYVTCEANFIEFIGDVRILSLRITVASRMARAEYGYLNSNALMSIKLLNGETVTLFAGGSDVGQIDNENNLTVYKVNFPVTRENQKVLTGSLIDKIKIVWSTGYEEYPVTNIDFFINQLRCLDNQ